MPQHVEKEGGRQKALTEALFHQHAPAIFAFLRQQNSSREEAEDLLLDIFMAALEHEQLAILPPERQQRLLWTIVRNKQIDAYRRKQRQSAVPFEQVLDGILADTELAPDQQVLRLEEYARLHDTLQLLSPFQQRLLHLRFVEGLRSPQIAVLVGKSETAVRSIISRTLNQLRKIYKEGEKHV